MYECMYEKKYVCMDQTYVYMNICIDGWMDGTMGGWMDR